MCRCSRNRRASSTWSLLESRRRAEGRNPGCIHSLTTRPYTAAHTASTCCLQFFKSGLDSSPRSREALRQLRGRSPHADVEAGAQRCGHLSRPRIWRATGLRRNSPGRALVNRWIAKVFRAVEIAGVNCNPAAARICRLPGQRALIINHGCTKMREETGGAEFVCGGRAGTGCQARTPT